MKTVAVNIRRHGSDPDKVYIRVTTDGGELILNCNNIQIFVEGSLLPPNQQPLDTDKLSINAFK